LSGKPEWWLNQKGSKGYQLPESCSKEAWFGGEEHEKWCKCIDEKPRRLLFIPGLVE
jgi:hypothetical protein